MSAKGEAAPRQDWRGEPDTDVARALGYMFSHTAFMNRRTVASVLSVTGASKEQSIGNPHDPAIGDPDTLIRDASQWGPEVRDPATFGPE